MKEVYLIHGWDGSPENNWFPWLKENLEAKGFKVFVPAMPNPEKPEKSVWVKTLQGLIKNPYENTYLVGHSMGCQAIQRYLETLGDEKIGGVVFVAGWIDHPHWEDRTEEELEVVHDWFDIPKDYEKMKSHCDKFVCIFSTDDPFISKDNWSQAEEKLGSKNIILENMSHFDDERGVKELPEVLESILEISR